MIAFLLEEKEDEKDKDKSKISLIKYRTVFIKKGIKICNYKALKISC